MTRTLKVYGCCLDGLHRTIVAASSLAEAARLWSYPIGQVRPLASVTGNAFEIELAMRMPGVVWRAPQHSQPTRKWVKMRGRSVA